MITTHQRTRTRIAVIAAAVLAVLLGSGAASAAWLATGSGLGAVPSDSVVTPSVTATRSGSSPTTRIDLSWSAPGQMSGVGYRVTRSSNGSTTTLTGCTTSPCADSGLAPGTSYVYSVTASVGGWSRSGSATETTQAVTVLSSFAVSAPSSLQAGVAQDVKVTALDQFGATFPGYTGPKSLSWSGTATDVTATNAMASYGPASFTNGTATVSVNLKRAGSALRLAVADGSVSGSTTVNVSANSPARLGFTTVSSAGVPVTSCLLGCTLSGRGGNADLTTRVSALDSFGNLATTAGQVTITLSKSASTGSLSPTSLAIAVGSSESSGSTRLSDSGNWTTQTLTATAAGLQSVAATITKQ